MRLLLWARAAARETDWLPTQECGDGYLSGKPPKPGGTLAANGIEKSEETVDRKGGGRDQRLRPVSNQFQMGC